MKKLVEPDLLIDGDILAYRASAACDGRQYVINYAYKGKPIVCLEKYKKDADKIADGLILSGHTEVHVDVRYTPEPLEVAIRVMEESIKSLEALISVHTKGLGKKIFFCTRHGSFRDKEFPGYKGNRDGIRRPAHLEACKDFLEKKYGAATDHYGKLEADDCMAMGQEGNSIICSIDKDLLQVPGHHFNWIKNKYSIVDEEEGRRNLYTQMLTGDTSDGIPGIKGVGPVGAKKALAPHSSEWMMYCAVLKLYLEKTPVPEGMQKGSEEFWMYCVQLLRCHARLLYLLRNPADSWKPPEQEKPIEEAA